MTGACYTTQPIRSANGESACHFRVNCESYATADGELAGSLVHHDIEGASSHSHRDPPIGASVVPIVERSHHATIFCIDGSCAAGYLPSLGDAVIESFRMFSVEGRNRVEPCHIHALAGVP